MDFSIIFENLDIYIEGLKNTFFLVSISLFIGLICAVVLAGTLKTTNNILVSFAIKTYIYIFRDTPLFVQMFIIYYGMGQFEAVKTSFLWVFFKEAYCCALLAFTLNTCAYTTEIIREAIENTPKGKIEAAKASGMSTFLRLRRIILPSALRRTLPSYGNEIIFMLHSSSLSSVITIVDISPGPPGSSIHGFTAPMKHS